MLFSKIKDQHQPVAILKNAINSDKISQSYLLYGPAGCGKFLLAHTFAMAINCEVTHKLRPCGVCKSCLKISQFTHPDLLFIFPSSKLEYSKSGEIKNAVGFKDYTGYIKNKVDKKVKPFEFSTNAEIRIESIRYLHNWIYHTPSLSPFKIILIENVDKMRTNAANAFLKTLEEPPSNAIIIMTTSKADSLLPTILSRCQKISLNPVSSKSIEDELINRFYLDNALAKFISRFSNGNMKKALLLATEGEIVMRKELLLFLDFVATNQQFEVINFILKYKSATTRSKVNEFFSYLILWLRDIAIFHYLPDEIINIDEPDLMDKFISSRDIATDDMTKLINDIYFLKQKLTQFVNPQLILSETYHLLNDFFFNH